MKSSAKNSKSNRKLYQKRADGYSALRVSRSRGRGKQSARLLIKCGDCDEKFEIYYGPDGEDLEIAGVLASVENWREILLPLLKLSRSKKYGATSEELDRFVRAADRQSASDRKTGKMKMFGGDVEADLAN